MPVTAASLYIRSRTDVITLLILVTQFIFVVTFFISFIGTCNFGRVLQPLGPLVTYACKNSIYIYENVWFQCWFWRYHEALILQKMRHPRPPHSPNTVTASLHTSVFWCISRKWLAACFCRFRIREYKKWWDSIPITKKKQIFFSVRILIFRLSSENTGLDKCPPGELWGVHSY